MKAILLALSLIASFAIAEDSTITLTWAPSPDPDIDHYVVKVGTATGVYTQTKATDGKMTQLAWPLPVSDPGSYYFFIVTAIDTSSLESDPSGELCCKNLKPGEVRIPSAPASLKKAVSLQAGLEMTRDLINYEVVFVKQYAVNDPRIFWRAFVKESP